MNKVSNLSGRCSGSENTNTDSTNHVLSTFKKMQPQESSWDFQPWKTALKGVAAEEGDSASAKNIIY